MNASPGSTEVVLLTGPKIQSLPKEYYYHTERILSTYSNIEPATDNWPFIYLKIKTIPKFYIKFIVIILFIIILIFLFFLYDRKEKKITLDLPFFFLGAAFMLIETKSIINFNLIFGSTWVVNGLVIIAILTTVLIGIFINKLFNIRNIGVCFFLLFLCLSANYFLPVKIFLGQPFFVKYILSSILFFSPIAFSNIIFAKIFKDTKQTSFSFGSNMFGAGIGGFFEYFSMIIGFHNIILAIAFCYLISFISLSTKKKYVA